jgi:hypothetical protein
MMTPSATYAAVVEATAAVVEAIAADVKAIAAADVEMIVAASARAAAVIDGFEHAAAAWRRRC